MTRRAIPVRRDLATLPVNFWLVGRESAIRQRGKRYTPASIRAHPGKMLPYLARQIITNYTKPGDWILDPMSGIGTTGVEAVHLGRHYVGLELEDRFVALQRENLKRAQAQGASGTFALYDADARRLDQAFGTDREFRMLPGLVDAVITSPPYGDRLQPKLTQLSRRLTRLIRAGKFHPTVIPGTYGRGEDNLGNLSDAAYLQEMRHVYTGCYQVLRPGGLLVAVIRPGRDRQRLRPLHHQTARLLCDLGFDFLDEMVAVLSRVEAVPGEPVKLYNHALFWKRLATAHLREAGWPITLEQLEYVLVFQKPATSATPPRRANDKRGLSAALAAPLPHRDRVQMASFR